MDNYHGSKYFVSLHEYLEGTEIKSESTLTIASNLKAIYLDLLSSRPSFSHKTIEQTINLFAKLDHLFFFKILRNVVAEEEHSLLISAIGNFGQFLAEQFKNYHSLDPSQFSYPISNVAFLIKGPFDLAHMSFVKAFIFGHLQSSERRIAPLLVFLDDQIPDRLKSISVDLTSLPAFSKLLNLQKIITKYQIGTLIWPSVAQTSSLYLGARFTRQQIYWSSRYRNPLFSTVDKYFFGARSCKSEILYNGYPWCYGRFYVAEWHKMVIQQPHDKLNGKSDLMWKRFIDRKKEQGHTIFATISTSRKLYDPSFHHLISSLLLQNPNTYYFYTSSDSSCPLSKYLTNKGLSSRFKQIKWITQMTPLLHNFDLIVDSFPVGASHALCYALRANVPFISLWSTQNIRSSLLETLDPHIKDSGISYISVGIAMSRTEYASTCSKLLSERGLPLRQELLQAQANFLNELLNNPTGMYSDFSNHILS